MSKQLKDWLDEFVDKGAEPTDVVNWPENSGGGEGGSFIIDTGGTYRVNAGELAKVVEGLNPTINYYIGYMLNINDSGTDANEIFYVTSNWEEGTYSLCFGDTIVVTYEKDDYEDFSELILDNADIINNLTFSTTDMLLGYIRENSGFAKSFDISKVLEPYEPEE